MRYLTFNKVYTILAVLLFLLELWIALIFKTGFIRHTLGDYIVVILLYCILKAFLNFKSKHLLMVVLLIAFSIEFLQLANLLKYLNLEDSHIAKLILGSTFHVSDLIAYTLGCATILIVEHSIKSNSIKP